MKEKFTIKRIILCLLVVFLGLFNMPVIASAAEKAWTGDGDASSYSDDDNWSPASEPTSADDITIDAEDASVVCTRTFKAKSITIGGRQEPTLTSNNFVYGTIEPESSSDVAICNRRGATVTLKGAGTITVKGQYKDSEESLTPEPSFMFWIK